MKTGNRNTLLKSRFGIISIDKQISKGSDVFCLYFKCLDNEDELWMSLELAF